MPIPPSRRTATPVAISIQLRAFDASLDLQDQAAAKTLGILRSDLRATELVSRFGQLTAGQLAEQLHLTGGAVTGLVNRMVRAGYFRRLADPSDRRKVVVRLSGTGRQRERRVFGGVTKAWMKTFSSYSADELTTIADFLRKGQALVDREWSKQLLGQVGVRHEEPVISAVLGIDRRLARPRPRWWSIPSAGMGDRDGRGPCGRVRGQTHSFSPAPTLGYRRVPSRTFEGSDRHANRDLLTSTPL